MIERVARLLTRGFGLSAEQAADVLWLAGLREPSGPSGTSSGPGIAAAGTARPDPGAEAHADEMAPDDEVPSPGAVPDEAEGHEKALTAHGPSGLRLELPRAMRQFKRLRTTGGDRDVDVEATVDASAELSSRARRALVVVTEPRPERRLDVVLVGDTGRSMGPWAAVLDEFQRLLGQVGAFRTITRWDLLPDGSVRNERGARQSPERMLDPAGSRLVLVATDASGPHWYRQAVWDALATWTAGMPTALVQVLPQRYWTDTALGDLPAAGRAPWPLSPNSRYDTRSPWWAGGVSGTVLPVVALQADLLRTWSQAIVTGTAWADGIIAGPPDLSRHPTRAFAALGPAEQVNAFLSRASAGAEKLARLSSLVPSPTLPLLESVQTSLAPGTGARELAELLVGGLLEEQPEGRYEFRAGVRPLLQRGITALEEWDVADVVERHRAEHPPRRPTTTGIGNLVLEDVLTPDIASADALVDVANIAWNRELGGSGRVELSRLTAVAEALAALHGTATVSLFAVSDTSLTRTLSSSDASRLRDWHRRGLVEFFTNADVRLVELAVATGLPIISKDRFLGFRRGFPRLVLEPYVGPDGRAALRYRALDTVNHVRLDRVEEQRSLARAGLGRLRDSRAAQILSRLWACPEPGCPLHDPDGAAYRLLPRYRDGRVYCEIHGHELADAGPRPFTIEMVVVAESVEVARFTVGEDHPVPVGREPGAGGFSLAPYMTVHFVNSPALTLTIQNERLIVRSQRRSRLTVRNDRDQRERRLAPGEETELVPGRRVVLPGGVELRRSGRRYPVEPPIGSRAERARRES